MVLSNVWRASRSALFVTLTLQWIDWGWMFRTRQMTWTIQRDIPWNINSWLPIKGKIGTYRELAVFSSGTLYASVYPKEVVSDCFCISCFLQSPSPFSSTYSIVVFSLFNLVFSCWFLFFSFLLPPAQWGWCLSYCVVLTCPLVLIHNSHTLWDWATHPQKILASSLSWSIQTFWFALLKNINVRADVSTQVYVCISAEVEPNWTVF